MIEKLKAIFSWIFGIIGIGVVASVYSKVNDGEAAKAELAKEKVVEGVKDEEKKIDEKVAGSDLSKLIDEDNKHMGNG